MSRASLDRDRRPLRSVSCPDAADSTDAVLLVAIGGPGARAALRELFDRHGAAVHRLVSLAVARPEDADRVVEDVFVTLSRRSGRLEDDVENVGLGLLAMALRRSRPPAASPRPAVHDGERPVLRRLPNGSDDALALTMLSGATLTEVAGVLRADRRTVAAGLRCGLLRASGPGHPGKPAA